jgi:hypothetical protein
MGQQGQPKNTEGTTRDVNAAMRAQQALQLRAQKLSYDEIAKRCGYGSRGACHNAIQRELQRSLVTDVETLRREELLALDILQASIWHLATEEKNKSRLFAVDRLLAIAERRAKLMGLDVPRDGNVFAANVVVREVPAGYLGEPQL